MPTNSFGTITDALMYGSSTSSSSAGISDGLCTSRQLAVALEHPVGDVRRGHDQIEVEFALEPLADDLHVQKPEEAATEAEPERLRRLGLVEQRGVVELQALQRITQLGVVVGVASGRGRRTPSA